MSKSYEFIRHLTLLVSDSPYKSYNISYITNYIVIYQNIRNTGYSKRMCMHYITEYEGCVFTSFWTFFRDKFILSSLPIIRSFFANFYVVISIADFWRWSKISYFCHRTASYALWKFASCFKWSATVQTCIYKIP